MKTLKEFLDNSTNESYSIDMNESTNAKQREYIVKMKHLVHKTEHIVRVTAYSPELAQADAAKLNPDHIAISTRAVKIVK